MVYRVLVPFLATMKFLTIIPIRLPREMPPSRMSQTMVWFPVIGLILGVILALVDWGLGQLLPLLVSTCLVLITWVVMTGGLHLDGFLDCCDALFAPRTPAKRLEILRDPHVGSFAIVGAVCLLLLKFALLVTLPPAHRIATLLVVPTLSRTAMVYAVRAYPYARAGSGMGRLFREGLTWRDVIVAAGIAGLAAGYALGWIGLVLVAFIWLLTVGISVWAKPRISGLTGDVYGAINELTEAGGLLCVVLIAGFL